ncbi:MAG TPA: lipopolysaccharide transport periplasmic protein LptA [Alcanivoracaceae bacterium]|nr:lipopolysaccharide transport periplasmic protein LptA [Alcanivoracaceae bacterium]
MFRNKWPHILMATLPLLLLANVATANPEADTIITADSARFYQHEGWGIYEGNAELEQGNRKMTARTIKLFINQNGDLTRVEAEGNPVTLQDGNDTHARAQKLVYQVAKDTITLTKNAYINNAGRTFEGARVVYHLGSQNVEASSQQPGERVRLVIPGEKAKP